MSKGMLMNVNIEIRKNKKWVKYPIPFIFNNTILNENVYTFLGVRQKRNILNFRPIAELKGVPSDSTLYDGIFNMKHFDLKKDFGIHSFSWFTLKELLDFDYEQIAERRLDIPKKEREEKYPMITYKFLLQHTFFTALDALKHLGKPDNVRVIFFLQNY